MSNEGPMNNELEQMLNHTKQETPTTVNPRLRVGPCVQGGQPLDGGPTLEIASPEAGATRTKDDAHNTGGPHITMPRADHTEAEPAGEEPANTQHEIVADRADEMSSSFAKTGHQLVAVSLEKSYYKGQVEIPVLKGVSLGVRKGEFLAIVGQSGSGKSTLLHLLGTLDAPDAGEIHFDGRRIDNLPTTARDTLRNKNFGMIFQFYHLLPELSTLENVLAPLMIAHGTLSYFRLRRQFHRKAVDLLEMVGLGHRLKHKPRELSGGEMQRAAIARALIAGPDLLLADEPTGNLDHATGQEIMKTLRTLNEQENLTIVMVTHDQAVAQQSHRVVRLADGQIQR